MAKYETVYADGKRKRTKKPKIAKEPSGKRPVASAGRPKNAPLRRVTGATRVPPKMPPLQLPPGSPAPLQLPAPQAGMSAEQIAASQAKLAGKETTSRMAAAQARAAGQTLPSGPAINVAPSVDKTSRGYKAGKYVGDTLKRSPTARVVKTMSKPFVGAGKLAARPIMAAGRMAAPIALPLLLQEAAVGTTKMLHEATPPEHRSEWAQDRPGYLASRMEEVNPYWNVQGALGEMVDRLMMGDEEFQRNYPPQLAGIRHTGAMVKPSQQANTLAGMPLEQGDPNIPTNVGDFMTREQAVASGAVTPDAVLPPETGGGGSASVSETTPPPAADYEYNPVTRRFEAKPYEAQAIQNPSISDILGNTRLSGLGGLFAINLASKVAKSQAAQNAFNEKQRQEGAKSALDWEGLRLSNDKLALAESLAPSEFVRNMAAADLAKATAKGQLTKSESQKLKFSEALIKEAGDLYQKAAELRAQGQMDQAAIVEEQANALFEGQRVEETVPYAPAINPNLLARIFGADAVPEQPRQTKRVPIDFKKLY